MRTDAEHLRDKLRAYIGYKLTAVETAELENPNELLVLVLEGPNKQEVEVAVLQDPEGNGPGWLDIYEGRS